MKTISLLLALIQLSLAMSFSAPALPSEGKLPTLPSSSEASLPYASREDYNEFSLKSNVLVFVLDRLDAKYISNFEKEYPGFISSRLPGFTQYTNATPVFARTQPGLNQILTGADSGVYQLNKRDYLNNSWTEVAGRSIFDELKGLGYTVNVYAELADLVGTPRNLLGKVDNVTRKTVDYSFYYTYELVQEEKDEKLPFFFKSLEFRKRIKSATVVKKEYTDFASDAVEFASLKDVISDMQLKGNEKFFKFYHFPGLHSPYETKEDGSYDEDGTSLTTAIKGNFNLLGELFEKMKELGIYDNTEIFILGDHGWAVDDWDSLEELREDWRSHCISIFHKKAGDTEGFKTSSAPVSQKNIPAAIVKAAGGNKYLDFGTPIDEIPENPEDPEDYARYFYKSCYGTRPDGKRHEYYIHYYKIVGDANDFKNWTKVKEFLADGYFF